MTTYTVTKEQQAKMDTCLSEFFGIPPIQEQFEDWICESNSPYIPFPGFPHTEESKKKISETMTGKKFTSEHRANMAAARLGMKFSPEHAAKCRENGIKSAEMNRQRMLGTTMTEETKQKISDTLKGRPLSEETKAKMSASRTNPKRYECPHCHKMLPAANLAQFHGDKCKMIPIRAA